MTILKLTIDSISKDGHPINWFYFSIVFVLVEFVIDLYLNIRQTRMLGIKTIPPQLESYNITTPDQFTKSQEYGYDKMVFSTINKVFSLITNLAAFYYNLLPYLWDKSYVLLNTYIYETDNEIPRAIVFLFIIVVIMTILDIPFSIYHTFVLEEKHGFNKTTVGLFIKDKIVSLLLICGLAPPIMAAIIFVIKWSGEYFWLYTWLLMLCISLIMLTIYPIFIAPLFNKFTPIEGELKDSIFALAKRVGFPATKMFVADNSRRNSHMNAYFYGFFKNKRIVLYDTLIKELDEQDVLAVLCHEFGHYKMSHSLKLMGLQQVYTLLFFYIFGHFLNDIHLFNDFGFQQPNIFIGLLLFSVIHSPIDQIFSFIMNIFSRSFEYQADDYAFKLGYDLSSSLAKLHIKDSSSLLVDKLYSAMHYTHPTLLERLNNIKLLQKHSKKNQ